MNRKTILEYTRTVSITILVTLISVVLFSFIIKQQVYNEQTVKKTEDETIDYYLIDIMIGKNQYLEKQNPNNYRINLKLGTLYKIKKDYKNAEAQYLLAIEKAPYAEYQPDYQLALLYLSLNLLDQAQETMDKIEDKPDIKLIKYKADIYNRLGDIYYNQMDYDNACCKYQKSLLYYKIIRSKKNIKLVEGNLASAYIYLAEDKLNQNRPDEAVNCLLLAKNLVNAPILKYKLAILSIPTNPNLSYTYFNEVFKEAPEIINYDVYYKFLNQLAKETEENGDTTLAELYRYKITLLKDYFKTNIVSVNDVSIQDLSGKIYRSRWLRKYNIKVKFKLINTSKKDIDNLWVHIIFKDGQQVIDSYSKQVADAQEIIKVGQSSPIVNLTTSNKKLQEDEDSVKRLEADFYISKTEKSYKLLLTTFNIAEESQDFESDNNFIHIFDDLFIKITSKLPAFLF